MFSTDSKVFFGFILLFIVMTSFCLQTSQVSAGKIYTWRDNQGNLHYSDSPHNAPDEFRETTKEYKSAASSITFTPGQEKTADDTGGNNGVNIAEKSANDKSGSESISIPYRAKEGSANRIIIDITFNGSVTAPILVDTGSPGLVVSAELANQLGLFDVDGSKLMVIISGIGGTQTAVRTIIDNLSIGAITEGFVPAHIVSDMSGAYQGLIGMDILSGYTLTIDPTNKRLIANLVPTAQDQPAGRGRSWWQTTFREFSYYNNFWEQQSVMIGKSDSPYSRLASSESKRVKDFIIDQKKEAQNLYHRLERFARSKAVPRHWRR
ncbi:MAG: aspartyl protease family protein [Thermodesulfobacteriota bacterium]|nr:aspartyl protease family protein [Thermodesulfobacteriota bacterium]